MVGFSSARKAAFLSACCIGQLAQAQPIPIEVQREAQRIQEREIERLNALEQRQIESQSPIRVHAAVEPEADDGASSGACAKVVSFEIRGMSLLDNRAFREVVQAATGECVAPASLKAVERAITNAYLKRGFITSRAFARRAMDDPAQVVVTVVEGRVADVKTTASEGTKPYSKGETNAAFWIDQGDLLNLRQLEQGVDQLSRLPSGSPQIDIIPSQTVGRSDLVVARIAQERWIRPSLSFANNGSRSTGKETATFSLEADSLLGLADFASLYVLRDIAAGPIPRSIGAGGFFSLPQGPYLISLAGNYHEYQSILTSNDLQFSNDGQTISGSLTLDRLLFRNARTKFIVSAQLSIFDTQTRIQDIRLSVNSYRLVNLVLRARLQTRLDTGFLSADLGVVRGLSILGASAADFGDGGPTLTGRKLEGGFALQLPIRVGRATFRYSTSIRGQYALSPVLAAERLSVGGEYSVRGYRDDGVSGDHGVVARTQLAVPLLSVFKERRTNSATRVSGTIGHDAGWVWNIRSNTGVTLLQSLNAGVEIANRRIAARILAAKAVSPLPGFDRSRPEIIASISLTL